MTKIKICGMQRMQDIDMVNKLLPDYVGFVFAKSRRQVSADEALHMKRHLNSTIAAAGVFVNAPADEIVSLAHRGCIDLIQLHGDETEDDIQYYHEKTKLPVIKAVRVRSAGQIQKYSLLSCDYLLLDTFIPGLAGGSGKTFDWSTIPAITKPYFLAGGLTPENAGEFRRCCSPFGVDVSSGVETNGDKDYEKIQAFIKQIKEGDSHEKR